MFTRRGSFLLVFSFKLSYKTTKSLKNSIFIICVDHLWVELGRNELPFQILITEMMFAGYLTVSLHFAIRKLFNH